MAIPKTLKPIDSVEAERLIKKHTILGTGYYEYEHGDFIYETDKGVYLIRKNYCGKYETGKVAN